MHKYWLDYFNPPIASQFDDALSYAEQMKRLYEKVHSAIHWIKENFNDLEDRINSSTMYLVKKWVNEKLQEAQENNDASFQEIERRMAEYDKRITVVANHIIAMKVLLEGRIQDLEDLMDVQVADIHTQIAQEASSRKDKDSQLEKKISDNMQRTINLIAAVVEAQASLQYDFRKLSGEWINFKSFIENRIGELSEELKEKIEEQLSKINGDRILVHNPATGNVDSLKKVLEEIYAWKVPFPIRVEDFNALNLKVEEFNSMRITVEDFNNKAALIFLKKSQDSDAKSMAEESLRRISAIENTLWHSALSMKVLTPYQCYLELASKVIEISGKPITMEEFNEKNIRMEEFNEKNILVEQFNFSALNYL